MLNNTKINQVYYPRRFAQGKLPMKTSNFEFLKPKWEELADVTSFVMENATHQCTSTAISRRVKITGCVPER